MNAVVEMQTDFGSDFLSSGQLTEKARFPKSMRDPTVAMSPRLGNLHLDGIADAIYRVEMIRHRC